MPKVKRGRISGLHGMTSYSAVELSIWAKDIDAQAIDPKNPDDPKWLKRRADKLRTLSAKKESAKEHKMLQKKPRGPAPTKR